MKGEREISRRQQSIKGSTVLIIVWEGWDRGFFQGD